MAFFSDLEYGNKIQRLVLCEKYNGFIVREKPGLFKDYDCEIVREGRIDYFEFKADRRAAETGNLAIETLCNRKPSGISTTKADFWIHCVCSGEDVLEVYEVPVKNLNEMILRSEYDSIRDTDNGRTVMYIFKKQKFAQWRI